jgi:NAD(P)-dependent dehydrogenase (short-subunit alcohol dehydrogenase family)
LTKEQLVALLTEFKDAISANQVEERGWPKWIYGISKLGINIFCNILSKSQEVVSRGIQVYSCCPGYVATDMTSHKGTLSVDEGIRTPVFLVELPFEINNKFQGQFFQKEKLSSTFQEVQ